MTNNQYQKMKQLLSTMQYEIYRIGFDLMVLLGGFSWINGQRVFKQQVRPVAAEALTW